MRWSLSTATTAATRWTASLRRVPPPRSARGAAHTTPRFGCGGHQVFRKCVKDHMYGLEVTVVAMRSPAAIAAGAPTGAFDAGCPLREQVIGEKPAPGSQSCFSKARADPDGAELAHSFRH